MRAQSSEIALFLRRWLAHPLRVGAVLPSSKALGRLVAEHTVRTGSEIVVELGAGTGTVTRQLINAGLPEDQLVLVELDPDLVGYLRQHFPRATIIADDATRPWDILPDRLRGHVDTVVSGIPVLQFPLSKQRSFVQQCFGVLNENGRMLQYTYSPAASPLPREALGIEGRRLGLAVANVPPAHVWAFTPPKAAVARAAE